MSFVLDASVALTWCFEDERTAATDELLTRTTNEGAYAPALWPLEVVNTLMMAERRGRIAAVKSREWLLTLSGLPVLLDGATAEQSWTTSHVLARRWGLTVYDAAYLELAQRLNLPLATLDGDLRKAAKKAGVRLLGK